MYEVGFGIVVKSGAARSRFLSRSRERLRRLESSGLLRRLSRAIMGGERGSTPGVLYESCVMNYTKMQKFMRKIIIDKKAIIVVGLMGVE